MSKYFVEPDSEGCRRCGCGKSWNVIGPDDVALSTSYGDKDDAEQMAERLNEAYHEGYRAGAIDTPGVQAIAKARDVHLAKGYDAAHDDAEEPGGALVRGALWILSAAGFSYVGAPSWAFDYAREHSNEVPRCLSTAGSLIAAELDRLSRAQASDQQLDAAVADHVAALDAEEAAVALEPPAIETKDEVMF